MLATHNTWNSGIHESSTIPSSGSQVFRTRLQLEPIDRSRTLTEDEKYVKRRKPSISQSWLLLCHLDDMLDTPKTSTNAAGGRSRVRCKPRAPEDPYFFNTWADLPYFTELDRILSYWHQNETTLCLRLIGPAAECNLGLPRAPLDAYEGSMRLSWSPVPERKYECRDCTEKDCMHRKWVCSHKIMEIEVRSDKLAGEMYAFGDLFLCYTQSYIYLDLSVCSAPCTPSKILTKRHGFTSHWRAPQLLRQGRPKVSSRPGYWSLLKHMCSYVAISDLMLT